jgi:hypothetical protein
VLGREAFVHEARLALGEGTDSRAPGGAITVALCGHWEHEGPCRWPHNTSVDVDGQSGRLRTVFIAPPEEEALVRELIERALRESEGWQISSSGGRPLRNEERPLAGRLTGGTG